MNFDEVKAHGERLGPLISLGTVSAQGMPHIVPLMAVWVGDTLVFAARASSLKVRQLKRHPAVAVQYLSMGELFPDALLLKGSAEVVTDDPGKEALWNSGQFPFLPEMYRGATDPSLCFVRFHPTRASLIAEGGRGAPEVWSATEPGPSDVHPAG